MRLMTSMLERVLDSLTQGTSTTRRARKSAMQRAVMEALEPRVLLTGSALPVLIDPNPSNFITYASQPSAGYNGYVEATVHWTNQQSDCLRIDVEVEEDG